MISAPPIDTGLRRGDGERNGTVKKVKIKERSRWILMCFQRHMRAGVMRFPAKTVF